MMTSSYEGKHAIEEAKHSHPGARVVLCGWLRRRKKHKSR